MYLKQGDAEVIASSRTEYILTRSSRQFVQYYLTVLYTKLKGIIVVICRFTNGKILQKGDYYDRNFQITRVYL